MLYKFYRNRIKFLRKLTKVIKMNLEFIKLLTCVLLEVVWYMAAFFRQVKIGVLTLTLEKKQ